jgi:hypothetical protein
MKKLLLAAIAVSAACMPSGNVVTQSEPLKMGYRPTANKKTAKRQKRKAQRRSEAAAKYINDKPHCQRNKKGRP